CGGLTILTSSPYALCHQLSNGAEVSIMPPPQAAINAGSGPRNPSTLTADSLSARFDPNVVAKIRQPAETAAITAASWSAMCAGVQKVSRPTDMCQEMSQYSPTITEVVASIIDQTYQGIVSMRDAAPTRSAIRGAATAEEVGEIALAIGVSP